jgi:sulfite reductase (NADPH) hemoprotein beta-component
MTEVDPSKLTKNEHLKQQIPTLAGNIAATLADPAAAKFSEDDEQFIKFHGIYQQDDRDLRKTGKKYMMMIRGRIPGGVMTPSQWIVFDELATKYGNNTLRITTRQSIQFHGVLKDGLGPLIKKINESLLSTLAACGDVNRNVMAAPTPAYTKARAQVFADAVRVADALSPQTSAYHSIWIEGVQLKLDDPVNLGFTDPLYGQTYLPRKFKVAFVIPPVNDMDVFTNDLGFIAVVENDQLVGYNLAVGGGMGRSHSNEQTYPRLADVLGFFRPEHLVAVSKAVLTIHRDFGDRTNRKHARFKYVVQEKGPGWVRAEINRRAGFELEPVRSFNFTTTGDVYGWNRAVDGSWFLTLFVGTGRVKDYGERFLKTALRKVAEEFPQIEFRLSANQNVILANVPEADRSEIAALLSTHGVSTENQTSVLHAASMACPALPTCGLALAESERMLPGLIDRIEDLCADVGVAGEEIIIRSTGCPNGCARPYMAEIAFVGKAPGKYQFWIGGNTSGTRLNRVFKEVIKDAEIENELRPLLTRWKNERTAGERFGDFATRVILTELPTAAPQPAPNAT